MSSYKGQTSKTTYSWEIDCDDGIHTVDISLHSAWTTTFDVLVDGEHILSTSEDKRVWNKLEIPCGGEVLLLVYFGARMDIVHRGMLVKKNIPYLPDDTLTKSYRIPFVIANFLSVLWSYILSKYILHFDLSMLSFLCFSTVFVSYCCFVGLKQFANSPLLLKAKKKLCIWLTVLWSWGTATVFPLMFWAIFLLDSMMT